MDRIIFHIDVNNAFLSWTAIRMLNEGYKVDLREIPSVVGGDEKTRSGIVLARSIPAKKFGIFTPETIYSAKRKCPKLVVVPPDYKLYEASSKLLYDYLCNYTPAIEKYSLDECYLDMTGTKGLFGDPIELAYKIQSEIKDKFGFTVNIGIGNNKLCAKMASDFEKPNKVHTLFMDEIKTKMWILPVDDLFMVGKKTAEVLHGLNINTIGELASSDIFLLRRYFKNMADTMYQNANGIDNTPVGVYKAKNQSISNENTFPNDLISRTDLEKELLMLSSMVGRRLRKEGYFTSVVAVILKSSSFESYTHQIKLENPINTDISIYEVSKSLLNKMWKKEPIRLMGIRLTNFSKENYRQTSLFDDTIVEDNSKIQKTMDDLKDKYGNKIIMNASLLGKKERK